MWGIIDGILNFVEPLLGRFYTRFADDGSFRSGFWWGLFIALLIGWASRQIIYRWNQFLQFFNPTQTPATEPGPSPFRTLIQAIFAFVVLAIVFIFILLLIARYLGLT